MRLIKQGCIATLIVFISIITQAQPWMEKVKTSNPSLKEVQDAFYEYWNERPIEKGQGYKQFKRWEWFVENRMLPDGKLPDANITVKNFSLFQQSNTEKVNRNSSTANWSFLGPSTSAGGYSGIGRINCMAFHPTNANIFWVGTPAGGIWKTTTGGTSWTTNSDNLPVLGVSDIAIDPTNANVMYIATGDGDMGSLSALTGGSWGDTKSIGVLKSTDGGTTWNPTGLSWLTSSSRLIRRLIINPANPQILVAATSDGIYRTTDGGTTWTNKQFGYFIDAEFKPGDPNIVYAATYSQNAQIHRSTNGGDTWTSIVSLPGVIRINLAVTPNFPALVDLVGVNTSSGLAGLWYSDNSGASFTQYLTGTAANNMLHNSYNGSGTGGQGHYDLAYAINPTDYNDIWLGGVNTWRTIDGGTTWNPKTMWSPHPTQNPNGTPTVHADKHYIAFHPLAPGTMYECNDGGLYKTTNGGTTWTDLSNGLGISQIYRIGVNQNFSGDVLCGLQDNGSKEVYNNTWYDQTGGDGMECIIDYTNGNVMYASYVEGLIYKTLNGYSWGTIVQNNGTAGTVDEEGSWVTPYIMHPTNNNTLLIGKTQVYKSTNGGTNWSQLGTITGLNGRMLIALAYAPSDPQVIYAASRLDVFKTSNGGTSWTKVGSANGTSLPFTYLCVDPADANKLYTTTGGYNANDKVWMLNTTTGSVWTNISSTSLPNVPVNCIVYQKNTSGGLYIGTDVGVFYKNAAMNDWVYYNAGLPNVVVTELEISYNDNKLWAATFGRGLWKSDLYQNIVSYVFTGNGDWNTAANWANNLMPPTTLPENIEITIDPPANGECTYNGNLVVPKGVKLTVKSSKQFKVTGNLTFLQ